MLLSLDLDFLFSRKNISLFLVSIMFLSTLSVLAFAQGTPGVSHKSEDIKAGTFAAGENNGNFIFSEKLGIGNVTPTATLEVQARTGTNPLNILSDVAVSLLTLSNAGNLNIVSGALQLNSVTRIATNGDATLGAVTATTITASSPVSSGTYTGSGAVSITTGSGDLTLNPVGNVVLAASKHLVPTTTNTQDLGLTGTRWQTGYFGTSVIVGTSSITYGDGFIKPSSDSTTALQLRNAAGTNILNVDTTNSRVGIGTSTPSQKLHIFGSLKIDTLIDSGDGADGSVTISSNKNINTDPIAAARVSANKADGEAFAVSSIGPNTITVTGTGTDGTAAASLSTSIAAGDEVILINMQGPGTTTNVGKYEFCEVSSVSSATITCQDNIQNSYGNPASEKVVVQRVPNYQGVTINTGITLDANDWAGTYGGLLVFRASGTVTVGSGAIITVSAKGYRGSLSPGGSNPPSCTVQQHQGESRPGVGVASGSANDGGGGAGAKTQTVNPGGGGGGAYGPGAIAGQNGDCNGGGVGVAYGSADLSQLFLGSAGGASVTFTSAVHGGDGGGIIYISANTINVDDSGSPGTISANGGNGQSGGEGDAGGGSGGSIFILANSASLGTNRVTASGGTGGTTGTGGNGGNGGVGRIRVSASTSTGTTNSPTAFTSASVLSYNDISGNLGIGTSSPSSKLSVAGLPTSGSAQGTLCIEADGDIFIRTASGSCT